MQPIQSGRRSIRVLFASLMAILGPSCSPQSDAGGLPRPIRREPIVMTADMRNVVEGNRRFALDLYARLRSGRSGNLFFSPASLSTALAMTYAGANGETADEMARVLHLDLPREKLNPTFGSLQRSWDAHREQDGYQLSVANRLWGQQGFAIRPAFLAEAREHFGAEPAQVDFVTQPEQARGQINAWVARQTQGKIADLIPSGVLDAMTRLVLTNAIYFKGDWAEPFRKQATRDEFFHISETEKLEVPLMHLWHHFGYWSGDGLKALSMPYRNGDLSMLVLLPDAIGGLSDLEAKLTPENLARWQSSLKTQEVQVYLPRFQTTSEFQLGDVLKSMGMARVFTPFEADLSGISESKPPLFVSAVIHKAFVDVNEKGTEAAAATGVVGAMTAAPSPVEPPVFRADHPFVFLIRDNRTGSLLFLGRLANPRG